MRLIFAVFVCLLPSLALAEDIAARTEVVAAKIFPQGARITRSGEITVPAGAHRLVIPDMPADVEAGAIQVGLERSGGMTVQALSLRHTRALPVAPVKPPAMLAAERALQDARAALDKLVQDRAAARGALNAAKLKIAFLNAFAEGKAPALSSSSGLSADDLAGLVTGLGTQIAQATGDQTRAQAELERSAGALADLRGAVDRAKQALDAATPLARDTATLVLDVQASEPYQGRISLSYQTETASWQPRYEVHVDQAADSGDLRLIRQAVIRQNTREDWRDVALSLSTASLTARSGTGLPGSMLYYLVDKDTIRPLEQFNAKGSAVRSEMAPMADAEQVTGMASGAMPVVLGQTLEFDLGTVASVDGDGGDQLVRLDALEEQVRLYARANAVQDATAYLYADVTNSTGGTLLAGPAVLYRDGTLTGQAFIPETLAGDVTELPLGPLNGLRLEHHTLKTEAGEGGFVTKSTTRTQRFEVTVDSSLDYAIDLTVYAALPVSEDEALTVRLETVPNPSDQNIEGRRGVTGWTKSIAPGASTTIEYGWTLSWPEDKLLQQR